MKRRGLTLMELLVVIVIFAIVTAGAARAFHAGIDFQETVIPEREAYQRRQTFEAELKKLIEGAFVDTANQDGTTYFLMGTGAVETTNTNSDSLPDTITFTATGNKATGAAIDSVDDFETQHQQFGPQGGFSEVSLSMIALGDPGERTGLFRRLQQPADGDATQGGFEEVFNAEVSAIGFEAFDGTQWVTEWDTASLQAGRLPSAIRVTYRLQDEEDERTMIVRLPYSDVTPTNPASGGATP